MRVVFSLVSANVTSAVMTFLKRVLMTPLWAASIFTKAKYFGNNPVIGSVWLNRCGLHIFRTVLAHSIYGCKQNLLSFCLASKEDRVFFRENGYLLKENFLPPEAFASLEREVRAYDGAFRRIKEGDTLTERAFPVGAEAGRLPALRNMLLSEPFSSLVRFTSARNERPRVFIERITQLKYKKGLPDPQKNMHKDTFHPTVKAWLYIDDVTEENGPFIYVPGSHKLSRARLSWEYRMSVLKAKSKTTSGLEKGGAFRVTEEDRKKIYGAEPEIFTVKKNTLIIADTFGFHCRGAAQTSRPRAAIWASSRVNPFNPFPGINSEKLACLRDQAFKFAHRHKEKKKAALAKK